MIKRKYKETVKEVDYKKKTREFSAFCNQHREEYIDALLEKGHIPEEIILIDYIGFPVFKHERASGGLLYILICEDRFDVRLYTPHLDKTAKQLDMPGYEGIWRKVVEWK